MKIPTILLALTLASCTTLATPRHCEQATAGLSTIEKIAAAVHGDPVRAQKLADAIQAARRLVAVACAQAGHPTP